METVEDTINMNLKNTLEYAEARALLLERVGLCAKIALIDIEIKKVRKIAPLAFRLAKFDMQFSMASLRGAVSYDCHVATKARNIQADFNLQSQHAICSLSQHALQGTEMATKQQSVRFQRFLTAIDQTVAWSELEALIAPVYEKCSWSAPRVHVLSMIKLYFLHQWCSLSDEVLIEKIDYCPVIRGFIGIHPRYTASPSQAALLRFRCLLEQTGLAEEVTTVIINGLTA
jgi:hypothetical protein